MRKLLRNGVLWGIMGLLWMNVLVSLAQGQTVFVRAKTAKLWSEKTSLSNVVAAVQLGEALQVVQQEANWLEVRTAAGVTGWIVATMVDTTKPSTGPSPRAAALGQSIRQLQASPVTASTGARGLDQVAEAYAQQVGIASQHRQAVDRMTTYRVPEQDIEAFLRQGRLGEYAQ